MATAMFYGLLRPTLWKRALRVAQRRLSFVLLRGKGMGGGGLDPARKLRQDQKHFIPSAPTLELMWMFSFCGSEGLTGFQASRVYGFTRGYWDEILTSYGP